MADPAAEPSAVAPPKPSPAPAGDPWHAAWRAAAVLFATILVALALPLHPRTGWNVNTRLALVYAVVEARSLSIDAFHASPPLATMDKAFFEGHYYSDKIFGVSLLALPFYGALRAAWGSMPPFDLAHMVMKAGAVALPGAAGAVLFWLLLLRTGTPPRRAMGLTAAAVFGTMWFGYGTVFYPYVPGCAAALGALYLTFFPRAERITFANAAGVGALLGFAMLCDLIFGLVVAGVGVVWLLRLADQTGYWGSRAFAEMKGDRSRLRDAAGMLAACGLTFAAPLALFAAYCVAIFGELSIPYQYEVQEEFREGMARGFMGVTAPKLHAAWFLTVHPYRGILIWSPIVAAGLVGAVLATRQYGKRRLLGWLGLWCGVSYLLFNAGYYMWWGGWSMGPRLMIPALPFVLLGAGELLREGKLSAFRDAPAWGRGARWAVAVLGAVSIGLSAPVALTDPQVPQGHSSEELYAARIGTPLAVPAWSYHAAFWSGQVTIAPWERARGVIGTENRAANAAGILLFAAVVAAGIFAALRMAPEAVPGTDRRDFPFRTVDGTAAPPPPGAR